MRWTPVAASLVLYLALDPGALAQSKPALKPGAPPATNPQAHPLAKASQPQVVMPDAEKIVLLLRSTLVTLNDAIQTGNFTVLRDVGAPSFRDANSAARLSQAFSDLASQGVDLSAVTTIAPQLTEAPTLDQQQGMLHLKGYFPGQPVQINFDMLYQAVGGRWRLFGLSVQPAASVAGPPPNVSSDAGVSGGKK
jgi:hypothetical protein